MMQTCTGLLEPRGSKLGQLKSTFNAENYICRLYTQVVLVYLQLLHRISLLKCALQSQSKIAENLSKNPFLEIQGCSRSSMLTNLKGPSPVLVMICSKSVPICNRFHTIKVNSGKITSF